MSTRKPIPAKYTDGKPGYTASKSGCIYNPSGKKLTPTPVKGGTSDAGGGTSKGHYKVHIGDKFPYVHRLVAAAFGAKIDGKEVLHKSDDQDDNRASQLRAGTRKDNAQDRLKNAAKKQRKGTKKPKVGGR